MNIRHFSAKLLFKKKIWKFLIVFNCLWFTFYSSDLCCPSCWTEVICEDEYVFQTVCALSSDLLVVSTCTSPVNMYSRLLVLTCNLIILYLTQICINFLSWGEYLDKFVPTPKLGEEIRSTIRSSRFHVNHNHFSSFFHCLIESVTYSTE